MFPDFYNNVILKKPKSDQDGNQEMDAVMDKVPKHVLNPKIHFSSRQAHWSPR
mgnify:CR=1 FL=1